MALHSIHSDRLQPLVECHLFAGSEAVLARLTDTSGHSDASIFLPVQGTTAPLLKTQGFIEVKKQVSF